MPLDKHTNGNPAKPFTPTLSSQFRSTKSPLTPKIIGSAQISPVPSTRREVHSRAAPPGRDELASPLNGNITPRSGTRKSRISTESPSTPGGSRSNTLGRTRAVSIDDTPKARPENEEQAVRLRIANPGDRLTSFTRPKSAVLDGLSAQTVVARQVATGTTTDQERDVSPQFFRAGQVKSMLGSDWPTQRPKVGPKAATFFYASESMSHPSFKPETARANSLSTMSDNNGKFFHANNASIVSAQHAPVRPTLPNKQSSVSVTSPRMHSPECQQRSRSKTRAPSPLKDPSPQKQLNKSSTSNSSVRANLDRRKSIESNISAVLQPGHKNSASTSSSNLKLTPPRKTSSPTANTALRPGLQISSQAAVVTKRKQSVKIPNYPLSPSSLSPRSTSLTSSNTLATSDTDHSEPICLRSPIEMESPMACSIQPPETPQAPQPNAHPSPRKQAEHAAAARRERKVLDLEISNSSLLAINKTLEREMRKQSAELRRFRRLSQSGRLSLATTGSLRTASSASGLSTLTEDAEDMPDPDHDDVFDEVNEFSSSEDDDDLESTLSVGSSVNPASTATSLSPNSRKLRRRRRDERRLLLDLSKHQQLLIDSQKLSQSIRRCLGWTEEMIREGERALKHEVGIGDVKLGGRVLREDENDPGEHAGGADGLREVQNWPELGIGPTDIRTAMEEAVKTAGPGATQTLGVTTKDESEALSPSR